MEPIPMPFNRFGKWEPLLRKPSFANTQINSCQAIERATQKYCNFKLYSNNLDYYRECGIYVCARHSFSRYMEHKVCDSCYAKLRKFSIGRRASSTCLHNGKDYLGYEFLGYHGTTKISAEAIMKNGPSTNCVKFGIESTLDSGEGFYITRDLSRAEGYAEDAFERYVQNPEGGPPIKRARIDSTEENERKRLEKCI